jgi:hypothetical protein
MERKTMPDTPSGSDSAKIDPQLDRLYDYTKFHIGLYTTVLGGAVAILISDPFKGLAPIWSGLILAAALFFAFAGLFGGIVAASTPNAPSYKSFMQTPTGPFGKPIAKPEKWIQAEHVSFWFGVFLVLVALFMVVLTSR